MRKHRLLSGCLSAYLLALAGAALSAGAQTTAPGEWTWMGGSNSACTGSCGVLEYGQLGVYGTLGVPAPGNIPGSRVGGVTWTDQSGHLWLFGGQGIYNVVQGDYGNFNDLWEFDPATNEWAWMGGSTSPVPATGFGQPGVYGTLGVYAAGNIPGGRVDALSWTDHSGHLWLFGGLGTDSSGNNGWLNDLWEFNPDTIEWAWMGGSSTMVPLEYGKYGQPGVYGTLGTPAVGNTPASRAQGTGWTDSNGNLWLFSGDGFDANGNEAELNDLWEFDPNTNEWAWMGGVSTMPSSGVLPGVYGTLGTPAAGNIPGARNSAAAWTDSRGNFWLLGGVGSDANGTPGYLNDLWEFNPSANEWGWMSGSSTVCTGSAACTHCENYTGCFVPGVYGTLGSPAAANTPGSRSVASTWTDSSGLLWLFGGGGIDANGDSGALNDLWEFNPSTSEWTWVGGTSQLPLHGDGFYYEPGVYGTLGASAPGNLPGSRGESMSWTDSKGYFWLFAGSGFDANGIGGDLNDLWTYQPPAPGFAVTGTAVTVNPGATSGNTATITLTPSLGFTGVINLSCAITPTAASDSATCTIPPSVTISGPAEQTTTLTINTTAATSALNQDRKLFWPSAGGAALACILLLGIPARRRRWQSSLGTLALLFSISCSVLACGGGGSGGGGGGNPGTTAGTYTITVTGTSGAITETGTATLTVQ